MNEETKKKIEDLIKSREIFIFMKGSPDAPLCGFSMQASNAIKKFTDDFGFYNVLEDDEIREAIKEYSDWPTLPQIYMEGEFVGGCDIVMEMMGSGELEAKIENIKTTS
jgi:monothiol glutaredoxin